MKLPICTPFIFPVGANVAVALVWPLKHDWGWLKVKLETVTPPPLFCVKSAPKPKANEPLGFANPALQFPLINAGVELPQEASISNV